MRDNCAVKRLFSHHSWKAVMNGAVVFGLSSALMPRKCTRAFQALHSSSSKTISSVFLFILFIFSVYIPPLFWQIVIWILTMQLTCVGTLSGTLTSDMKALKVKCLMNMKALAVKSSGSPATRLPGCLLYAASLVMEGTVSVVCDCSAGLFMASGYTRLR